VAASIIWNAISIQAIGGSGKRRRKLFHDMEELKKIMNFQRVMKQDRRAEGWKAGTDGTADPFSAA
jgi:hypothetical protein